MRAVSLYVKLMTRGLALFTSLLIPIVGFAQTPEFTETKAKAEKGDVQAQYELGMKYLNGAGVSQSFTNAIPWLRKAADHDYSEAQAELGLIYINGGVPVDYVEAYRWLNLAAQGARTNMPRILELRDEVVRKMNRAQIVEAQHRLLAEHPKVLSPEFKSTKAKAEKGEPEAQYHLAEMYAKGEGVWQNDVEAARWYRPLAEAGQAKAQQRLAMIYSLDRGVTQDLNETEKWLRKAAGQNYDEAQVSLGMMYLKGQNMPKDVTEAIKWFRRAADQGLAGAQLNLGIVYDKGDDVPVDFPTAAKWYRLAADAGNRQAQYNLGKMYAKGEGPPQDDVEAYKWISLAAAQENLQMEALKQGVSPEQMQGVNGERIVQEYFQANLFLETLKERMRPEQIAEAKHRASEFVPKKSTAPHQK